MTTQQDPGDEKQGGTEKLRVCLAGATGWAGSALAKGILLAEDLELVAAVSRSHAGQALESLLDVPAPRTQVYATVEEALAAQEVDVFVEYTKPGVARGHVLLALEAGAHTVIGTSGLTAEDFEAIDEAARRHSLGVLACGNFSLTAALMMKFSELAARWIPNWELIDYASASKADAPSGTARELAHRLSLINESTLGVALEDVQGAKESRGARLEGSQVHSVRLPGYVLSIEALFGLQDEKLTIRHDAGASAEPYVGGALLAIRKVGASVGLQRGLDKVMEQD